MNPDAATLDQAINLITPLVALVATWAVKRGLPKLPGYLFPVVAALAGLATTYAEAAASGGDSHAIKGILLGLAATGLHQINVQLNPAKSANSTNSTPPSP
jgi:hypothetical protein